MVNVSFTVCSIILLVILNLVYFSKKRLKTTDNTIFSTMLIITLVGSFLEFFSYLLTIDYINKSFTIYKLANKFILLYYLFWNNSFFSYILSISEKKKMIKFANLFTLLAIGLCCLLPISFTENSNLHIPVGLSVIFVYVMSAIYAIFALLIIVTNFKKEHLKKYIPLFFLLTGGAILMVIQFQNPSLLMMLFVHTLIVYLMYFTIENPDMKMIEQLNTAKDAAEKANRAKSDFLSSMSHEIRTPLNAIVGFSECILNENDLESAKGDAKDIIMASQNLLEIVNGILDISKIEADKMEIVESEYSMREVLESLTKLTIPRIGEKPIEFKTKFAPDIPSTLYGDSAKVKQIISNILTNAVKYTERGIITFEVNCINKEDVCSLVISVEDTGRGIKADKIDTIFNKFERLEEDRNTTLEGTGLGLAITKRLVEMMGGKIVVQSKYGAGSKFTVYLKQEIRTTPIKSEKTYTVTVANADFSNKKVLVVDDNKINLKVATRMLEPFKITVEECMSGEECIQKIQEGASYDLILMDDMMPKITGTETFHELEKIESFQTPVVVLTANAIEGMREKYLQEGFSDYLAKPIDKLELERVLGTFLAHTNTEKKEDIFEPLPEELFDVTIPLKQDE